MLKAVHEVEDMDGEEDDPVEQAGSLVMPRRRNWDMRDDHSSAFCQLYMRIREIWKTTRRYEWKTIWRM